MTVLLTSVFGPFGVDDAYGRKENVMELFHNQVTREQGVHSLRFHHPSFGLHFIAENLLEPTTVLDFPSEQRFIQEIRKGYEWVGISFIVPNFVKAKRMAELVRIHAPQSRIVLGGHGTRIPDIEKMIDHDHICTGEGVSFMRELLGEDPSRPFKHPAVASSFGKRIVGLPVPNDAAVLVPGVGCPNACRFCATSHYFDRKYTSFFDTGKELFEICRELEERHGFKEFFVMDENFLKRAERARELVRLMEEHGKMWRFGIFSSAETIARVGVPFLARLGVYFLWLGVESKKEVYEKNRGIDPKAMIQQLRDHGVSVLASGILFLEDHDQQTIWDDIEYISDLGADLVQFMQLGPLPKTSLYVDYDRQGLLRKDIPFEEWHGQHRIWFRHPHFTPEESETFIREAFRYDYDTKGPSFLRMCETLIRGVRHLARYDEPFMVERRAQLRRTAQLWRPTLEAQAQHAHNAHARAMVARVMAEYEAELGSPSLQSRLASKVVRAFTLRESLRRKMPQPRTMVTPYRQPLIRWLPQWSRPRLLEAGRERRLEAATAR